MKLSMSVLLGVALLCVMACGGSQAEKLCDNLARAHCDFAYDCCNAAERQSFAIADAREHSNKTECIEALTRATCSSLAPFTDAENTGRMTVEPEAVDGYLATVRDAVTTCDAQTFLTPNSDQISALFVGAVSDGDDCFNAAECASLGSECVQNDDPNLITATGYCDAPPAVGAACPDNLCAPNATCVEAVCVALPALSESCAEITQCRDDLACSRDEFQVCIEKRSSGQPCNDNNECVSSICDPDQNVCAGIDPVDVVDYNICVKDA